ncbi:MULTISPECIES: complex I subunit 5 family protein [unclassified Dietzia]|uniref:complex I subunit 5 family protein n=1 Tax=unclassified Dietzia TaxID=2617939 RepID=UPI000B61C75B|nr:MULTISPECIES: proton-conducting transporter membrane subunit [unclassified Dietzia]ASL69793.1 putative NADH dehydrogenase I chain M [Dietzia sp. DQ12-45-1b]AVZ38499.1 proton-conducting membrane transporter [Dietzia sp. JS16-p6b]MBB1026352.1 monovalent cation/H+ antiporter subunit D family protein [Dietzia sp. DQ11-38-2]QGW23545.1 putative NADH dehydrogenase I chain M [Dietzia sp. DQ12-45-1b]
MTDLVDLMPGSLLVLAPLAISLLTAVAVFLIPEGGVRSRSTVNLGAAVAKLGLIALMVPVVVGGARPEWRTALLPGIDFVLRIEPLSLLFAGLSSLLWLLTTVYAIGYLEDRPHRSRFFGFFALCVTATVGIAFSGNLVTFLLFYELLTLVTYPLVVHNGTAAARRSGRLYMLYTLGGGLSLLTGIVWLSALVGDVEFTPGGVEAVGALATDSPATAVAIFALMVAGLGVKAALFPLHGWLPRAMVAPAPVSALLHAVAVVKAGVFGLVRVIDDVYGVAVASALGVLTPLLVLASFTVLYGSVRALFQDDLKKRLAYSTVSQVSYITLGITLVTAVGTAGGLAHLVHQGLMKITLFFCAGLFAEVLGIKTVSALAGLGRRMPWTCAAFTVGAFGMIGVPPVAGFISKWELGLGALDSENQWVIWVLVASAVLNSAYFLPPVVAMWFRRAEESHEGSPGVPDRRRRRRLEAPAALLAPAVITAGLSLAVGIVAAAPYAPLAMATFIARGVFP